MNNNSDCCDGEFLTWPGEPIQHEVYMKQTPWFICQYHICYGFAAPESDNVCPIPDSDVDLDGWFQ